MDMDVTVSNCVNVCFDGQTSALIILNRNTIIYRLVVVYWVKWTSSAGFRFGDSWGEGLSVWGSRGV
jgi:hypothetical protein